MSKLDKDTVIENYTKAYTQANGKAPSIEASGGWYSVDGGKKVRLAQLDEDANAMLASKAPAKENDEKPAKTKKAAKPSPKKEASKKVSKKIKAAKAFSVKDFYTQQIQSENPGAKAPR